MYRLFQGDSLRLLGRLPLNSFDALITDPPYASGDPRQSSAEKYITSGCKRAYTRHSFYGENLSQRSWMHWCADWLELCIQVVRPGGVAAVFCDWRQLPALMDAMQYAGWIVRGVMPWDKGNARPQPHQPKQVCEFIVWGSNGKLDTKRDADYMDGIFRGKPPSSARRVHQTEKSLDMMRQLVHLCVRGGTILDPFAGYATTLAAAILEGYQVTGIEKSDYYFNRSVDRLEEICGEGETVCDLQEMLQMWQANPQRDHLPLCAGSHGKE